MLNQLTWLTFSFCCVLISSFHGIYGVLSSLSLPNTYILYYYYYYYYLTRYTFVSLVTCSPFRNKDNLKFQQHKNRKNINNIHETQIKARKARNHSYDVVSSKTSFKKYGLEYIEITHLNNSKTSISPFSIGHLLRKKINKQKLEKIKKQNKKKQSKRSLIFVFT